MYDYSFLPFQSSADFLTFNTLIANTDLDLDELTDLDVLVEPELEEPPMFAVIMYNDDYTPMDFVVSVLQSQFYHTHDTAVNLMLTIHHQGKATVGIYPRDIAETKAQAVNALARSLEYPLLTVCKPTK